MTDVLDYLEAQLRPTDAPDQPTEGWSITGLETAAWASRKAAAARRKQAQVRAWADAEIARIQAVADDEAKRFEGDATFFEGHLAAFLAAEIKAGRKTKSLELPGGIIKLTARQPKVEWDEERVLAWIRAADRTDLVRVKESLDRTALKKAAELVEDGVVVIDGEIVPGASWEAQEDSASFVVGLEGVTP